MPSELCYQVIPALFNLYRCVLALAELGKDSTSVMLCFMHKKLDIRRKIFGTIGSSLVA